MELLPLHGWIWIIGILWDHFIKGLVKKFALTLANLSMLKCPLSLTMVPGNGQGRGVELFRNSNKANTPAGCNPDVTVEDSVVWVPSAQRKFTMICKVEWCKVEWFKRYVPGRNLRCLVPVLRKFGMYRPVRNRIDNLGLDWSYSCLAVQ